MSKKQAPRKEIFGMPMNWEWKSIGKNMWNADSKELFPPKNFGIGWTINFHALLRAMGVIKKEK
jgi:uncharacterized membrane protein